MSYREINAPNVVNDIQYPRSIKDLVAVQMALNLEPVWPVQHSVTGCWGVPKKSGHTYFTRQPYLNMIPIGMWLAMIQKVRSGNAVAGVALEDQVEPGITYKGLRYRTSIVTHKQKP